MEKKIETINQGLKFKGSGFRVKGVEVLHQAFSKERPTLAPCSTYVIAIKSKP